VRNLAPASRVVSRAASANPAAASDPFVELTGCLPLLQHTCAESNVVFAHQTGVWPRFRVAEIHHPTVAPAVLAEFLHDKGDYSALLVCISWL